MYKVKIQVKNRETGQKSNSALMLRSKQSLDRFISQTLNDISEKYVVNSARIGKVSVVQIFTNKQMIILNVR